MFHREDETYLRLADIGAAVAVLDQAHRLVGTSPAALRLLGRFQLPSAPRAPMPSELVRELTRAPRGEAIMWRHPDGGAVLGCTRYALGDELALLVLREITEQQRALNRRLHQQRLESTGRLVAHIAHDLRAPLSSIVYNADLLGKRVAELPADLTELVHDTVLAADQLRRTVAGLLDYVRLGPPVSATLSVRELVDRVASLLRPVFRAGNHELTITLHDEQACVCGNPIAIEQILVNLLVNATEAAGGEPVRVHVSSEAVPASAHPQPWRALDEMVRLRVADDGPGIPPERRQLVFEPFITSKDEGTGLGLTVAREAAVALGGHLSLEDTARGASFAVVLPVVRPAQEVSA